MIQMSRAAVTTLALACALAGGGPVLAQEAVGLVVASRGRATVTSADGTSRAISCGDVVQRGEVVETQAASRIAVLTGDVYAQLFVLSRASFGTTADGTPLLELQSGRMRVIDPRGGEGNPPVQVSASGAQTRFAGNDVDAYVMGPAGATNAAICSERSDLVVTRDDRPGEQATAADSQCAIASLDKTIYTIGMPSERIALAEANDCELPIPHAALLRLQPQVAAGPELTPLPQGLDDIYRDACDVPGSGCAGGAPVDTFPPFPFDPLPGFTPTQNPE
jgi:hypothetical protein